MDMVKLQQTWSEEGYMAMNPPGRTVGMAPWKPVATQGPQHLDPKTEMLGHFFLGSTLEQ